MQFFLFLLQHWLFREGVVHMNFHATVVGGIKESVASDTNRCPDFILRPAFWKALTKISYYQYLVIKPSAR